MTPPPPRPPPGEGTFEAPPESTLFVGGLPQDCTDEELLQYFTAFGEVKVEIKRQPDGRSRGFGFVYFPDDQVRSDVLSISVMDGHEIRGKKVDVKDYFANKGSGKGGKLGLARASPY
jgi:RNA-binding protein Musashi